MNWIQDCSISSTLECWPDKLQTCNCRSKWSVNACLSCSGKAVFRAQLNARRHKEEVLHQCVWSNSSILHLIPAAEKVKRCKNMFSGSISLQKPASTQRLKPSAPTWPGPRLGRREPSCASAWHTEMLPLSKGGSARPCLPQHRNGLPNSPRPQQHYCPSCIWQCQHCTQAAVTCTRKAQRLILNSLC